MLGNLTKIDKAKHDNSNKIENEPILSSLKVNLENLRKILNNSNDIVFREFCFGQNRQESGALIYISGMVDNDTIHKAILKPLMYDSLLLSQDTLLNLNNIDIIIKNILTVSNMIKISLLNDLLNYVFAGSAVLLVNGTNEALVINIKKLKSRDVEEPPTESVVRGPRDGFTEDISTNIALLRRKIKDSELCLETLKIGDKTKTDVCIAYEKNIADPKLIDEIRTRLQRIHIDGIFESGNIEQLIEDAPLSIFSTVNNTEKPDRVAAKILEGRAAIFVDGTPFVLTVPMLFIESFQSTEDYYSRTIYSSFIRLLRFIAFIISVLTPSAYVAFTVFHQELIPTQLLISIEAGHKLVPFPAFWEAALVLFLFDILREAGLRLPKPIGSAVSIVGALVIGQSSVSAGLISPIMVIVVATTAISSFVVPSQNDAITLLRYIYLILAALSGGFGLLLGILINLIYLASLRSFGVPYFWPISPLSFRSLKDTFIRMPIWMMDTRPTILASENSNRQSSNLKPSFKNKKKNDDK